MYGFTQLCNNMAQHTCVIFLRHIITWYGTTHVCHFSPLCVCNICRVIQYKGTTDTCDISPLCVYDICPLYNTKVQNTCVIFFRCACVISVRYTIPRYNRYVCDPSPLCVWYLSVMQYQGTTDTCVILLRCACDICPLYNTKVQHTCVIFFRCACVISVRHTIPRYKRQVWSSSTMQYHGRTHVWSLNVIQ